MKKNPSKTMVDVNLWVGSSFTETYLVFCIRIKIGLLRNTYMSKRFIHATRDKNKMADI